MVSATLGVPLNQNANLTALTCVAPPQWACSHGLDRTMSGSYPRRFLRLLDSPRAGTRLEPITLPLVQTPSGHTRIPPRYLAVGISCRASLAQLGVEFPRSLGLVRPQEDRQQQGSRGWTSWWTQRVGPATAPGFGSTPRAPRAPHH